MMEILDCSIAFKVAFVNRNSLFQRAWALAGSDSWKLIDYTNGLIVSWVGRSYLDLLGTEDSVHE